MSYLVYVTSSIVLFCLIAEHRAAASAIHQPIPPSEPYSYHFDPYSFGYDVKDNYGNKQWKQERSNNPHEVHGSYGYRDNNGIYREVTYVADKDGFRANIKTNEPGVAGTKSPAGVNLESYYSHQPTVLAAVPVHSSAPVYTQKQHSGVVPPLTASYYQKS